MAQARAYGAINKAKRDPSLLLPGKVSLCSEMISELRQALCCQAGSKKAIKNEKDISNSTNSDTRFHPPGSYTSYGFITKEPLD